MNEELQTKLAAILGSLSEQVQSATDATVAFGKEQLPLIAKEIIAWAVVDASIAVLAWSLPPLMLAIYGRRLWGWAAKQANASGGLTIALAILLTLGGTAPLIGTFVCLPDVVKPIVAPRVYLIEWCANHLK